MVVRCERSSQPLHKALLEAYAVVTAWFNRLLRGLVMIVMPLDYTRDFLAAGGVNPLDLTGCVSRAGPRISVRPLDFARWRFSLPLWRARARQLRRQPRSAHPRLPGWC
jgi:hypothetical protein